MATIYHINQLASHYDGVIGRQGGRKSVSMGAAVILKNYLTFSILTVFLYSFVSLVFALILSLENKPNTIYFLLTSFMLAVLGAALSTDKNISLTELIKLFTKLREK